MSTLNDINVVLKEGYLPAFRNQIGTEPSPLLEKIEKPLLTNSSITATAPKGINGGFGFSAEGESTPRSAGMRYEGFTLPSVDMYVNIEFSDKLTKLAVNSKSAMLNALNSEVKSSYESAKWHMGRAIFGNGTGILARITAAASGAVITVSDTSKLIEGTVIDVYTYASAAAAEASLVGSGTALRISAIDRAAKKVTLTKIDGTAPSFAVVQKTGGDFGFVTVQGSYKRELCGIGAIFDDEIDTLYGVKKADNNWIKPIVVDAAKDISDIIIHKAVRDARDYKNSSIDMLMMGDEAFSAYQAFMQEVNTRIVEKETFVGGAVGYKVMVGNREVTIVNERFVPSDEAWGVDTKSIKLYQIPWDFADYGGNVFTLQSGTSIYRALLSSYGNLICENPGGCIRIKNCAA